MNSTFSENSCLYFGALVSVLGKWSMSIVLTIRSKLLQNCFPIRLNFGDFLSVFQILSSIYLTTVYKIRLKVKVEILKELTYDMIIRSNSC